MPLLLLFKIKLRIRFQMLKTKDGVKIMTVLPQKGQKEIKVNNENFNKCHATKKVYCRCCHVCF